MADKDFLDQLQAGRDAVRKMQRSLMRMAMPEEQRKALLEGMSHITMPGDQLQTMVDLMDAFGPPLAQVEALRDELAEQRAQVDAMSERLAHMEAAAERLTSAAEQLVAFQGPFVKMAEVVTGQKATRPDSQSDPDTNDDSGATT